MESAHKLFQRANELLDKAQLEEAVELFEKAALMENPTSGLFNELPLAWQLLHFKFANEVVAKYPQSTSAKFLRVRVAIANGWGSRAVTLCTEHLQSLDSNQQAPLTWYASRFKAACQSNIKNYVVDDFITIWNELSGERGKVKLLQDLFSVPYPEWHDVFINLSENSIFPEQVGRLFLQRADFLKEFKALDLSE